MGLLNWMDKKARSWEEDRLMPKYFAMKLEMDPANKTEIIRELREWKEGFDRGERQDPESMRIIRIMFDGRTEL